MHQVQSVRLGERVTFIQAFPTWNALEPKWSTINQHMDQDQNTKIYIKTKSWYEAAQDQQATKKANKLSIKQRAWHTYIHTYMQNVTLPSIKQNETLLSIKQRGFHTYIHAYIQNETLLSIKQFETLLSVKQRAWHTYIHTCIHTKRNTTIN